MSTWYRCEWQSRYGGVVVETSTMQADERPAGWYATKSEARLAEAQRMSTLASELMQQARHLTHDRRGD